MKRNSIVFLPHHLLVNIFFVAGCLVSLRAFPQMGTFSYDRSWNRVDSLIIKASLPKSALTEVQNIYQHARAEKNEPQIIRSLVYTISLGNTQQSDINQAQRQLENEALHAGPAAAAILYSLDAQMLWDYFKEQRYRFYDKTNIKNDSSQDMLTWSADHFHKRIKNLFLASLQNTSVLQANRLETYDPIVIKGNTRYLRPTLYDLLVNRALDYFMNDEQDLDKATDAFELNDSAMLSDHRKFVGTVFRSADTGALQFKALLLFQDLIRFHEQDVSPAALIDADINRIEFVHEYAAMDNKDAYYINTLGRITQQYPDAPEAAQAWYLQASAFSERADAYDPKEDTTDRYANIQAVAICERVIREPTPSQGKSNCLQLLQAIRESSLNLKGESVNLPEKPFRLLVTYKNLSKLFCRIIRIDDASRESMQNGNSADLLHKLSRLPVYTHFTQLIPDTRDFQQHRTEIKVDALPLGQYAICSSTDSSFAADSATAIVYCFVSSIAVVHFKNDCFVLNRETGKSMAGVTVKGYEIRRDGKNSNAGYQLVESHVSDANGFFQRTKQKTAAYRQVKYLFAFQKDYLSLPEAFEYDTYPDQRLPSNNIQGTPFDQLNTFLFCDRAIYRPGQILFFKGIATARNLASRKQQVLTQFHSKIYLVNPNGIRVDSLSLATSDFGSFHATFTLPANGLNGHFRIEDSAGNGSQSFSVEEYKRPTFFVTLNKTSGTYHVGDSIALTGFAQAYAGNAISGSMVLFRIVRQSRLPFPEFGRDNDRSPEQEIAHGAISTDGSGKFQLRFRAIPDRKISPAKKPVFTYRVTAVITDLNGETRDAQTNVAMAYQGFEISIGGDDENRIQADSLGKLSIVTRNFSGDFVPVLTTITLYRLTPPARLIRTRYWDAPDQFTLTENEYVRLFPNDEYDQETDKQHWARSPKLSEQQAVTTESGSLIDGKKYNDLAGGWYELMATARDADGSIIVAKRVLQIISRKRPVENKWEYNLVSDEHLTGDPGQTVAVQTGSSAGDVYVIRAIDRQRNADSMVGPVYSNFSLNRETKTQPIVIGTSDHGGFGIYDVFVRDNRIYHTNHLVDVPWKENILSIQYQTFRDKTLPGSAERWKVRITGNKKAAAELLTSMYDASLDPFSFHRWNVPSVMTEYSGMDGWGDERNFGVGSDNLWPSTHPPILPFPFSYDVFIGSAIGNDGQSNGGYRPRLNEVVMLKIRGMASVPSQVTTAKFTAPKLVSDDGYSSTRRDLLGAVIRVTSRNNEAPPTPVQIRRNFNETAFFFPQLHTDADGSVEFSFTMPEALTTWKWMLLAHTKDLAFGYSEKSIVTQKELMLQPNIPRFLRAGDTLLLPVKIANLSKNDFSGNVRLQWIDPEDSVQQDLVFQNTKSQQSFTVAAGLNTLVQFPVVVPADAVKPITYRLIAQTDGKTVSLSDGEEAILPVLTNRLLVTESLPLKNQGAEKKEYHFEKLLQSGESKTLRNQSLTVEYTANPAWYAVQSLPYVMEFPYECAEQTFNRFYANAVASTIVARAPGISAVLTAWKNSDTSALMSNLQQNESLKSALLRETPWVLNAASEAEQHKHLALLYDLVHMNAQLNATLDQFSQTQAGSGGFAWFKGGRDDRYITQYILSGIGHLTRLQAIPPNTNAKLNAVIKRALPWLDQRLRDDYNAIDQKKNPDQLSSEQIQFLYMRSFFNEYPVAGNAFNALHYFRSQSIRLWQKQSTYMRGMIALALFRTGDIQTARNIMASIKEHATISAEQGMYFKDVNAGYYWQQAPVETQALLIEAFTEITQDEASVDGLRTWLLQQKRTSQWSTTRATADACYALLLRGTDWLNENPQVKIAFGDSSVSTDIDHVTAGTGYIKKQVRGEAVTPSMGNISLQVVQSGSSHTGPGWGSVYWQYFENMDKITSANSPLSVTRSLFVERNENGGPVLEPITASDPMRPGDKIKVRLIIRSDRDLEYVHLKDLRASCFEPVDVLSEYRYQDALGYYQATSDASTSFFFDRIAKGTYVIEYELLAATIGSFSNGISTIQCMYAPEFAAHTEGTRVQVAPK